MRQKIVEATVTVSIVALAFGIAAVIAAQEEPWRTEYGYEFQGLGDFQVNWECGKCTIKRLTFQKGGMTTDFWVDVVLENTSPERRSYTLHCVGKIPNGGLTCAGNTRYIGLKPGEARSQCINFYTEDFRRYEAEGLKVFTFRTETK